MTGKIKHSGVVYHKKVNENWSSDKIGENQVILEK